MSNPRSTAPSTTPTPTRPPKADAAANGEPGMQAQYTRAPFPLVVTPFKEVEKLRAEMVKLREEERLASLALRVRHEERERAVRLDAQAAAKALRVGNPDMGNPRTKKVDKEIEEFSRRVGAASAAIKQVEDEVVALLEENREKWISAADAAALKARAEYQEILNKAMEANNRLRKANTLLQWAHMAPTAKVGKVAPGLTDLISPSGDRYSVPAALGSLVAESAVVPNYALARQEAVKREGNVLAPGTVPGSPEEREALRERMEQERQVRIAMGAEDPPRRVVFPTEDGRPELPPNAVIGG